MSMQVPVLSGANLMTTLQEVLFSRAAASAAGSGLVRGVAMATAAMRTAVPGFVQEYDVRREEWWIVGI